MMWKDTRDLGCGTCRGSIFNFGGDVCEGVLTIYPLVYHLPTRSICESVGSIASMGEWTTLDLQERMDVIVQATAHPHLAPPIPSILARGCAHARPPISSFFSFSQFTLTKVGTSNVCQYANEPAGLTIRGKKGKSEVRSIRPHGGLYLWGVGFAGLSM